MKLIRIKHNCTEADYIVPREDIQSKSFVMSLIKNILTGDEGEFILNSFSIEVNKVNNCASDGMNMAKIEKKKLEKVRWE